MAAQETKKARREPNFTEEERLCLLNFLQQHKIKLLGKAGRPGHGDDKVEERKARYWKLCAESIKAAGGRERDWRKVRKQWFDLKDKAKRLKNEMGVTGGGPKPPSSGSLELAMEVVARKALDGIRGRTTEVDPLGHASVEMSQDSSQDSETTHLASTSTSTPAATAMTSTTSATSAETGSLVALQQQVNLLQSQVEMLGNQPSSLQRATELRQLKFQEELLKLEKKKVDLQSQSLEVQKKMLAALEALGSQAPLHSMAEK